jgi:hypothetical protein
MTALKVTLKYHVWKTINIWKLEFEILSQGMHVAFNDKNVIKGATHRRVTSGKGKKLRGLTNICPTLVF